jgi:hypothetical protein
VNRPPRVASVPRVLAECACVVAERIECRTACPAGILPFRVGGETIALASNGGDLIAIYTTRTVETIIGYPALLLA